LLLWHAQTPFRHTPQRRPPCRSNPYRGC